MSRATAEVVVEGQRHRDARGNEPFLTWKRLVEWSLIPLAFVILRFVPPLPGRSSEWALLLMAAVLFASPVILSSYREYVKGEAARSAEDLAVEYRLRLGLTLGEAVIPMGDLLGRIVLAGSEERAGLQGQMRQRVVDAAAALTRPERSRAVFFALEGRTLRAAAWAGRAEPPQKVLVRSDPEAEAAYRLMERHARVLVPDIEDAHAFDFGLGGEYASFLCVAVYAGTRNLGLLSVDAPERETLDESDMDIVAALAQTLGPGLAIT